MLLAVSFYASYGCTYVYVYIYFPVLCYSVQNVDWAKGCEKQGAVGLRMRVYGRTMCFVNCHFAAHLEAVNRRNDDFDHVFRTMTFTRPSNPLNAAAGMVLYLFLYYILAQ